MSGKFFQFSRLTREDKIRVRNDCILQLKHKIQIAEENYRDCENKEILRELTIYYKAISRFYDKLEREV